MSLLKNIKISFDFDYTLERDHIKEYAKELIQRGFDVWVVTSRYSDDMLKECDWLEGCNKKLWHIVNELKIKKENVVFTNYQDKWNYFENKDFLFHLDDLEREVIYINTKTKVIGVDCFKNKNWKNNCEEIIKIKDNNEKD